MKKIAFAALVAMLVLGLASVALAAAPSTIDPATGQSAWTYQDLHDTGGAKYEGGYQAFDSGTNYSKDVGDAAPGGTDATGPHGGYSTTTNKCKVCHAVHRAEGAYYLLRADSQDDACSYCHVGSAHSTRVVYDLNPDGIYTTNGHTIGAQAEIPDSTIRQESQAVTLSTTDATGAAVTETIHVRSYDTEKNKMYRFARHHGQSAVTFMPSAAAQAVGGVSGSARSGYQKIGPLALRCMSCHQPHNAVNEVWRPRAFAPFTAATYSTTVDGGFLATGYKLLRRSPSGSTTGMAFTPEAGGELIYYGANQVVKAIEDSATAGVNFSQHMSAETTYLENGVVRAQPLWIAQDIHAPASGDDTGVYRYPNKVNNMALSWWCADCHNLNIGGWEPLANEELGFKAHTERTHPAPYYGAYTGPGQCYSCHRNDLPVQMGTSPGTAGGTAPAAIYAGRESCTQCHFGTGDYYQVRANPATMQNSDFPHSGSANDIKMLGAYNITNTNVTGGWTPQYNDAVITANQLDQVCLRCHPGIGINH